MALQRRVPLEAGHRPWPLPRRPWLQAQTWTGLLFAHWRVGAEALARVMPPQLAPDVRDGSAWIGVTPFRVDGFRIHGLPPPPFLSTFCELNVRTYVTVNDKPGIYFFSLDAASWGAVIGARRSYRLPYFRARMSMDPQGGAVRYRSERISRDGPPAAFGGSYRPTASPADYPDGSLDRWLTERYCLYVVDSQRRLLRAEIHHPPWPLQPASAEIELNTMAAPLGIELEGEPLVHFSARQDTVIWNERPVEGERGSRPEE
jgi:uncharacterized protein YqjF (DUF2071 family)